MNTTFIRRFGFLMCVLFIWQHTAKGAEPDSLRNPQRICTHACCCSVNPSPLGIMTDHLHPKGDWAFSYSFMQMNGKGNLLGTEQVSDESLLKTYMMAPDAMVMNMHMLMGMYGISNRVTLMAMGSYVTNHMTMIMAPMDQMMNMPGMQNMTDMPSSCNSAGLGDTKVWAWFRAASFGRSRLVLSAGMNIPTGSTKAAGITLLGQNTRLPYMMQLGSGTWDVMPGVTYTNRIAKMTLGFSGEGTIPVHINTQGYAWGPQARLNGWLSWKCLRQLSASLRMEGWLAGRMQGYDAQIAPLMLNDPSTDARLTGGERIFSYIGISLHNLPFLNQLSVQAEFGLPVYQRLNGPQQRTTQSFQAGITYSF